MYSVEYKCTRDETEQTTNNMIVDIASKQSPQYEINNSLVIHGINVIKHTELQTADS